MQQFNFWEPSNSLEHFANWSLFRGCSEFRPNYVLNTDHHRVHTVQVIALTVWSLCMIIKRCMLIYWIHSQTQFSKSNIWTNLTMFFLGYLIILEAWSFHGKSSDSIFKDFQRSPSPWHKGVPCTNCWLIFIKAD